MVEVQQQVRKLGGAWWANGRGKKGRAWMEEMWMPTGSFYAPDLDHILKDRWAWI